MKHLCTILLLMAASIHMMGEDQTWKHEWNVSRADGGEGFYHISSNEDTIQTTTLKGLEWTFQGDCSVTAYTASAGQYFGSAAHPVHHATLTTSGLRGVIKSVRIESKQKSEEQDVRLWVRVNGVAYGDTTSVNTERAAYTFTPTKAQEGTIEIGMGQYAETVGIIYFYSIEIVYEDLDYTTDFHFTNTDALTYLAEHFDDAEHNKTLVKAGWQNVVRQGERGWWTIDEVNGEDLYCAKVTSFVSGTSQKDTWDLWLVTPPLDYRRTTKQVFSFRVRGNYMTEDMDTQFLLYYIDATDPEDVYFESIDAPLPYRSTENGNWYDIVVDLSGQSTISDVFYMAFRYVGSSGMAGLATYYVDDVVWGDMVSTVPTIANPAEAKKVLENGKLYIERMGVRYDVVGHINCESKSPTK